MRGAANQLAATQHLQLLNTCCLWGFAEPTGLQCGDPCRYAVGFFLYYFRHWQTGNGRRVGKGRVRKVEEEAGYGKGRNESQCERGYFLEQTTCSVGILFIILDTGAIGPSTTTSTSTATTTLLTATSKCIGSTSPTQYILSVYCVFRQNCEAGNGECLPVFSRSVIIF